MRIWDLRRGDADDNRMSPAGGGLRSLILSAALEFNYLQAAIGFLALVIGPALLVGIMPSVVVTYGRLMIHTATSAGDSLIVALVLLVVLGERHSGSAGHFWPWRSTIFGISIIPWFFRSSWPCARCCACWLNSYAGDHPLRSSSIVDAGLVPSWPHSFRWRGAYAGLSRRDFIRPPAR